MNLNNNNGYNKIVGTGGIGVGLLFHSPKLETLGRSESRSVLLSKAKDYCKQHIVLYYAATLTQGMARTHAIGFVGDDTYGHELIEEMDREGIDTQNVGIAQEDATTISICLQYPDHEGCNITAINNASRHVTQDYIQRCLRQIGIDGKTIIAAIPEVPIESRMTMLKTGKERNAYTVLSVPAAEAEEFLKNNAFAYCDMLAVNAEEARAILGKHPDEKDLVPQLYAMLRGLNPRIELLVTCGKNGAYTVDNGNIEFISPLPVEAVNTAGAGDAFLGGMLAGLAKGLPLQKHRSDARFAESKLESAAELGALCAGMAVETQDSIALNVTPGSIREKIEEKQWEAETWFIS